MTLSRSGCVSGCAFSKANSAPAADSADSHSFDSPAYEIGIAASRDAASMMRAVLSARST